MSLTDKEALKDAKRSLHVMIHDFLKQHRPKMSNDERNLVASQMDMSPISEEYERELNRPIQNLLSGRIARLVLIQLQFVKKELLVSMQAIDELFNANQVNLQLLAVTPVVVGIFAIQIFGKAALTLVTNSSRGRLVESRKAVYGSIRARLRNLERVIVMSPYYESSMPLSPAELGRYLCLLYRLQTILALNSSHFDNQVLKHFQEDLRDLTTLTLGAKQRLTVVHSIIRYHHLQSSSKKTAL